MKRVYIIHGYTGHPEKNWFPWLKNELQEMGFAVEVPAMPNAGSPQLAEWLPFLHSLISNPDEQTFLVGHSLGCIAILRYLESLPQDVKIGGALLVAGFSRPIHLTELNNFFETPLDYQKCKTHALAISCINSTNDPHVPLEDGIVMQDKLSAKLFIYKDGGHLNEKSGFKEFALVRDKLLWMVDESPEPKQIYDVGLVLGSGIKEDGSIPESAKIRTQKAVDLYRQGKIKQIIFSGKWTYSLAFTPPHTEAEAMANYALTLGLPKEVMLIENESNTTVSNFCYCKRIIQENTWQSVLLIINRPYHERAFITMQMVFGPEFQLNYYLTNFHFSKEKEDELERLEENKIENSLFVTTGSNLKAGDDHAILAAAQADLRENYLMNK